MVDDFHVCQLPEELDLFMRIIPGEGRYLKIKRWFSKQLVISYKHPNVKPVVLSKTSLQDEIWRQLYYYPCMIHPFSKFRQIWEGIMVITLGIYFIYVPLELISSREVHQDPHVSLDHIISGICILDIILTFFTGYYQKRSASVVFGKRAVALHYVLGYFIPDFISSVPMFVGEIRSCTKSTTVFQTKMFLFVSNSCKLIRLGSFVNYSKRTAEVFGLQNLKFFKVILFGIVTLMSLNWIAAFKYWIQFGRNFSMPIVERLSEQEEQYPDRNNTLMFWHYAIMEVTLSKFADMFTDDIYAQIASGLVIFVGIIVSVSIKAVLIIVFSLSAGGPVTKYEESIEEFKEYAEMKNLPEDLTKKIIKYYAFNSYKRYYKETAINRILTSQLHDDILYHAHGKLIEQVIFFRDLDREMIIKIAKLLKSETFMENDLIVNYGSAGDEMYFIVTGTVAVFTGKGREVCHLDDGAYFGEVALIMENEQRIANVVAIETTQLLILERKQFRHMMASEAPELYRRMRRMVLEKMGVQQSFTSLRTSTSKDSKDLMRMSQISCLKFSQ